MVDVSIVMTAFNRAAQVERSLESIYAQKFSSLEVVLVEDSYDGGKTESVAKKFPVKYLRRDRPHGKWANPSIPNNMGIRAATGKVLILQNGETRHVTPNLIKNLSDPVLADRMVSTFANVRDMLKDGTPNGDGTDWRHWRLHHKLRPLPLFFCQCVDRQLVVDMRGFDELYTGCGFDDNDFSRRLEKQGIKWIFLDDNNLAEHQWHESEYCGGYERNELRFVCTENHDVVRNIGREWGVPDPV
jgi:GT2 family glycosyltransferase